MEYLDRALELQERLYNVGISKTLDVVINAIETAVNVVEMKYGFEVDLSNEQHWQTFVEERAASYMGVDLDVLHPEWA